MIHPYEGTVIKLRWKVRIEKYSSFIFLDAVGNSSECMKFIMAVLQILEIRWLKFSWLSNVIPWNYNANRNSHVRKSLVICATQLAGGLLLKMLKYFEVMLNIFEFSNVKKILEPWLVYLNKFSWIIQSCFLTETIKES